MADEKTVTEKFIEERNKANAAKTNPLRTPPTNPRRDDAGWAAYGFAQNPIKKEDKR